MNFTKIEIIGFKSFANKTVIRFDHGITGIVGPNGCGKSNVADAIRWVLGEQSPKSLRGSSMQDVIFNGTQSRKSLSYCEVSLYFDNSNGIFKSEDYSEVILTRKLFRSGESEYYINKKPRRLKDIINLLHECGLSKEGYTIIGQNKVTEILSSKPTDRRAIFEEAVGIAKTKAQRLETERMLMKTQDNIRRFSDMCMDLELQLAPLSRQAETAREYNQYSSELKMHEVNSYLCKMESAADEKSVISTRLNALTENLEAKQAEYSSQDKLYNESMATLAQIDQIIKNLNEEILNKTVGIENLKGKAGVNKKQIEFLEKEIERMREENNAAQAKINAASQSLLEKKSFDIKSENELQQLLARVTDLGNRLSEIMLESDNLSDIKSSLSALSTEKSVITEQVGAAHEKIDALSEKLEALKKDRGEIADESAQKAKEISSLLDEIEASENGVKITDGKLADINKRLYSLGTAISTLEATERFSRGLKESFEGFQEAVRRLMLAAKEDKEVSKRIKGVVASIISTDKQYETAIEIAMGNAIQNIVTDNERDAQYLIDFLKRNGMGRATFLPVSAVKYRADSAEINSALRDKGSIGLAAQLIKYDKYYEPIVRYLLGNTLVCDNLDNAVTIARKYRFAFKIVTLDGDVLSPQGSMTGGSRRQNSANLLSIDGKLEEILKDLAAKREEYEKSDKRMKQYAQTLMSLREELSKMNADYNTKKQEQGVLKEKLSQTEQSLAETESELESYREMLKSYNTRLDEISRRTSDLEQTARTRPENGEKIEHNEKYYEEVKKERDKLIEENTAAQRRLEGLKSEIAANKAEITRLTDEISAQRELIRANDQNISNNNGVLDELKRQTEQLLLSDEDMQAVGELREKLKRNENRKEELQGTIERANIHKEQLNVEIQNISADKIKEEFNLQKIDNDLEAAKNKLINDYDLNYDGCLALKVEDYNMKTSASEIEKLKRKIKGLGPINNKAIEDYESINSIYQDNMLQKQDLEKGADDLRKGIQNLTEEMTAKFNAGFEVIRSNFRKIFKELFGGGSADLLLDYDNCDDPLEAGVEIFAEPPGKKLQKISLLSGGEMALTAIAILFAILRLSPMPFCVLDEIEAALDEANVERFARYLKNFSEETQFIVITHKKVTMELADALFGVTMQEKGVSSIVSVELSDIHDSTDTDSE